MYDFSFLAQLHREVRPLSANIGGKQHGPSEATVAVVLKALTLKKAQLVSAIAKKIGRSQSNTGWCLTILKARGQANHLQSLGARGAKQWVRI